VFSCRPTSPAEEKPCAERIVTGLAAKAYGRDVGEHDVSDLMTFYTLGAEEGGFEVGVRTALEAILASPHFLYRMEREPAEIAPGEVYRIADIDLASRLSFFLWGTNPDEELLRLARSGELSQDSVLRAQAERMLQDPRSEALAVNFAGQWLNLRGLQSVGPLPMLYPDFDDPLRQAMRREVELLFDAIVREDHPITELLTADYTYVNERLAKHYGIKNIYGSQFRRVPLGPGFEARRGLTGKGAFLVTTSKPDRTSPVTRGKWVMTNLLGMSPPSPPADVPPLPARAADQNAKEPSMRKKMMDHRVRNDCTQCHRLMDPIGFSLENFDAIGLWRSHDEGEQINAKDLFFDNTTVDGPVAMRDWLVSGYGNQFVLVATEKLLTYALGRGLEAGDMPLVRAITRDVIKNKGRFSSIVLGIVRSQPFQVNMRVETLPGNTSARATLEQTGVN
jgi:hypothetical protein